MDWRALSVLALIVGVAVGFAGGWHFASTQSMEAAYQRGVEAGRNKAEESKYAAQVSASNAKIAEINRQIDLEKKKNDQLARQEATESAPAARRYSPPTAPAAAPMTVAAATAQPTWGELEAQRAGEVRADQDARLKAEERARADQEIRDNTYYYLSGGMYHRYGCAFLTEPLVRAKLKDARLAAVPCNHCQPPR